MAELMEQPEQPEQPDQPTSAFRDQRKQPDGVVPKQSQTYVIVALALLILFAVMFSKQKAKTPARPSETQSLTDSSEINARKIEE